MFAVIRTGGKQYKVRSGDEIRVERLAAEPGASLTLDNVLLIGDENGASVPEKARVNAEVVSHERDDKIIVFKKKRRQKYRRKAGHRQQRTVLKITGIAA